MRQLPILVNTPSEIIFSSFYPILGIDAGWKMVSWADMNILNVKSLESMPADKGS